MKFNKIFIFILLILGLSVGVNATLIDNNKAYWTYDNTLVDATGNGYTMSNFGSTYTTSGKINGAYDFDGTDDRMDSTLQNSDIASTDLTFSIWINLEATGGQQTLFNTQYSGTSASGVYSQTGDGTIIFSWNDGSGGTYQVKSSAGSVSLGSWLHVLATMDESTGIIKIYLDGVEDSDTIVSSSMTAGGIRTNSNNLDISSYDFDGTRYSFFNGKLDEPSIWTRMLNQLEITELYNSGFGLQYPFSGATLTFTNITANNITLINNTFYNSSIDFETTILNTSTNGNVNHSYSLQYEGFNTNQLTVTNETLIVNIASVSDSCEQYSLGSPNTNINTIATFSFQTGGNVDTAFWNGTAWIKTFSVGVPVIDDCISESQYTTNSLTGSVNLNLTEGSYNISFQGINNQTSVNSTNYSFIVDRTLPVIKLLINDTIFNAFAINFNNVFNVTDALSGLSSCNINITELENVTTPDNQFINCTDSINFLNAGLHNAFVIATDNAGNINTTEINFTINPYINIFFNQTNGSIVLNYTPTIYHPDGRITFPTVGSEGQIQLSPVNNGSLDLGNHTIQFSKLGFTTQNFTQLVNETNAGINVTFNVTDSVIVIRIFDRETNDLLTGLTTITLQSTTGFNTSTLTGLLNISDITFINEQYQILALHEGYNTETVFFNYNNQEILNIDIFMLNSTAVQEGKIKIIVKNTLSQFVESVVCSALEWRPSESAFISVAQGLTNVVGETFLNIELNTKIYKFSCTKDTFTTVTNAQIIQVDASSLNIILNDIILAPTPLFPNLVTSMTNTTLNSTHELITYDFADSDGLTTQACIKVYLVNGNRETFNSQNCVSSSSGTILLTVDVNQSANILIQGTLTTSEVTDYIAESITIKGTGDIAGQLKEIGLDILIPTILMLLGLGLGILLSKIEIAVIFIAIAGWVSVAFVPTVMKSSIAMFITVIVVLMLWGGYNRK